MLSRAQCFHGFVRICQTEFNLPAKTTKSQNSMTLSLVYLRGWFTCSPSATSFPNTVLNLNVTTDVCTFKFNQKQSFYMKEYFQDDIFFFTPAILPKSNLFYLVAMLRIDLHYGLLSDLPCSATRCL